MFRKIIIAIILWVCISSCDNYLDIKPIGQIIPTTVEDYRKFITAGYNIPKEDKILTTYRTEELFLTEKTIGVEYYKNIYLWQDGNYASLSSQFPYGAFYSTIFYANEIIENRDKIEGKSAEIKQLVGEAYALRALQYFDLINLYAKPYNEATASTDEGVPLVLTYDADKEYPRATVAVIYQQIEGDIQEAEKLLNVKMQKEGFNYRFSILALKTLKATLYLYQQKWENVIEVAQEALAIKSDLQDLNTNSTILPSEYNSVESILALNLVSSFDISANALISEKLKNSYDKENDLRFSNYFIKTENGLHSKKNASTQYRCTFRTADLFFMLAEAQANLGKLEESKTNLLLLAEKRYNSIGFEKFKKEIQRKNKEEILSLIREERKREFAIEGKRWFDLRRTTQPELTKIYNGATYILKQGDSRYILPFPKSAVISNPLLK
ncbi:MAG: RagB/SusD family nutrient uptake outer membrane protein [Flavobacteriaceae bacterium]|nr:RagB/SusD family nutrient uptake outer membrane protein [Flavobacteriaceae bacterium]